MLLLVGVVVQVKVKRYRSLLERRVEDKSEIIKFAFTFGSAARAHLYCFQEAQKRQRITNTSEETHRVPNLNISS